MMLNESNLPIESSSFEKLQVLRHFEYIKQSIYPLHHLPRESICHNDIDDLNECQCTYPTDQEDMKLCCLDVSCLNFATYIECNPLRCRTRKYCGNQRLQHPDQMPLLEPFPTLNKGYGVRTKRFIKQTEIVGEYIGEIIDTKELEIRLLNCKRYELNFYYLELQPGIYIDARKKGNFTRFVNHSCAPNCTTEKWIVNGEPRIAVIALRDIEIDEELTFDYQWKSLGTQKIKCHCGELTCRGVIGDDDINATLIPNGVFREPTIEEKENSELVLHRRIRFMRHGDSEFQIATIKGYDEKINQYEIEYEIEKTTLPDEDLFESPTTSTDDGKSNELIGMKGRSTFIQLQDVHSWHIYCALDELSEEEKNAQFFAIPKKLVPKVSPMSPQSKINESNDILATGTTQIMEMKDAAIENNKNEPTKVLVKRLTYPKCTTTLLQRWISRIAEVKDLDLFFFPDTNLGWALVTFPSYQAAQSFQKSFHNRPLFGQMLRVIIADAEDIDRFSRQKQRIAMETEQKKKTTNAGDEDKSENNSIKATLPYAYGRKLNWMVSEDFAEASPSTRAGLSSALESSLRQRVVDSITLVVRMLHFHREDATSAILALQKMLTFHPIQVNVLEYQAFALLLIYLKARSREYSWKSFVSAVYTVKYKSNNVDTRNIELKILSEESPEFRSVSNQLVAMENVVLENIRFDLISDNPHAILESMIASKRKIRGSTPHTLQLDVPTDVYKEAKHMLSYALQLPIWNTIPITIIIQSILCLSAAVTILLKDVTKETVNGNSNNKMEDGQDIPEYIKQLEPNSILYDCIFAMCKSLSHRWIRLETQAKENAKKQHSKTDKQKNGNADLLADFKPEAFELSKKSSVDITQRMSEILHKWFGPKDLRNNISTTAKSSGSGSEVRAIDVFGKLTVRAQSKVPTIPNKHLTTGDLVNRRQIRKNMYLAQISPDVQFDVVNQEVMLLTWNYGNSEKKVSSNSRGLNPTCLIEFNAATHLPSLSETNFPRLIGIIFPPHLSDNGTSMNSIIDNFSAMSDNNVHYLAFEKPLHLYSGLFDARISLSLKLRKQAIFDMLQALSILHENEYVHRQVSASQLWVFDKQVKLGGINVIRQISREREKNKDKQRYRLSESDRKEQIVGSWLNVTAPEILLGDLSYTARCDMWSAGYLALSILIDHPPSILLGKDVRHQVELIFRLCGTPDSKLTKDMSLFKSLAPAKQYKSRLTQQLEEIRQKYTKKDIPEDAMKLIEGLLQIDPSKRLTAKNAINLSFFDDIRDNSTPESFSTIPSSFSIQEKKYMKFIQQQQQQIPNLKRKLSSSEHQSSSSTTNSSNSATTSSRHSSSKRRHVNDRDQREKREHNSRSSNSLKRKRSSLEDDVPLPTFFHKEVNNAEFFSKSISINPTENNNRSRIQDIMTQDTNTSSES